MKQLIVDQLTTTLGGKLILENISFSINSGEITAILGANGAGKTTLLKSICSILPHKGSCKIDDAVLEHLKPNQLSQRIGFIPQKHSISLELSVMDVVMMGFNPSLSIFQEPTKQMIDAAIEALATVGLSTRADSQFLTLSEGEKQLCLFARATINPSVELLLLDEPESSLDFQHRYNLIMRTAKWIDESNARERAVLLNLHDPQLALNCSDTLILLKSASEIAILHPRTDSIAVLESHLQMIYGNLELQQIYDREHQPHYVLLRKETSHAK